MPSVDVIDLSNKKVGTLDLADAVFGAPINEALLYEAVRHHLAGCQTCPPRCRCDRAFLLVVVRALTAPCPAPAGLSESVRALLAAQIRAR